MAWFIPAGAGNSSVFWSVSVKFTVHPRWRGEQVEYVLPSFRVVRFIPAGAGNSKPFVEYARTKTVHPRWRGEQVSLGVLFALSGGSSPLARGTVYLARFTTDQRRFIPAGAGNRLAAMSVNVPYPLNHLHGCVRSDARGRHIYQ